MASTVLFDLYDTLVWTDWPVINTSRAHVAKLAGVDPAAFLNAWNETIGARSLGQLGSPEQELSRLLAEAGAEAKEPLVRELVGLDERAWRQGVHPYADVVPTLQRLRQRGCRLAVLSNCSWQGRHVLEATAVAPQIDAAILSFEAGLLKPDPAFFRFALEFLAEAPENVLFVDDGIDNVAAAQSLGMRTLLIGRKRLPEGLGHPSSSDLGAIESLLA